MSKSEAIACKGIKKAYRMGAHEVPVLRGIQFEAYTGEALSIMGASGSGKSTLLNILGLLDAPDEGNLHIHGDDATQLSEARRTQIRRSTIGFIFQAYHLLPELTVLENVLLPLRAAGFPLRAGRERAEHLLEEAGLSERLTHRPMELSGGEQQRAAMARALINQPDIVLADEPTGNLDSQMGEQVLECLFRLTRETGKTLIMVTHNADIAGLCNRRVRMEDGLLVS
jgi:ABC-type lipoprotein export system ATPase subunit